MKKLSSKLPKLRKEKKPLEAPAGRITTDTLAEHRERVLAGGRKFKYPVQYARHKLVINASIIGVIAIILIGALGWYALYPGQNTNDFMYRVTRVVPVPVASIEGESVRYSDYLMRYRSEVHFLTQKAGVDITSEDGKRQLEFLKTQAMQGAIADTYAEKLAREQKITVTDAELEGYVKQQRQSQGSEVSESTYNAVILDYYGWSPEEYRHAMKKKLLRQKVAYAIDDTSRAVAKEVSTLLAADGATFKDVAAAINAKHGENTVQAVPAAWVPKSNRDYGLSEQAAKLEKGGTSGVFELSNGAGLAFVRLIDRSDVDHQYEYISIPLKEFEQRIVRIIKFWQCKHTNLPLLLFYYVERD